MKKMLLTAVLGILWLNSYSQNINSIFESTWEMFKKNSVSVIELENETTGMGLLESKLRAVEVTANGGFSMHYTYMNSQSSKIYYFNRFKMLTNYVLIQDLKNRDEQIETFLSSGFYRKSPYTYYHKILDLMVVVKFDNSFVSFNYSKKPQKNTPR